ncbi:hypothetical protein [Bathymodiolus platifrons methanotrophic gill symbiont]|uniref:hypothetical protein n=1 Tax=Bathymodiolus platifrons methanotrophic gill symbiont TaxID=113268 RepID=UPI00142D4E65|nr:hypothetical protein [Bathymodiolus platifrons methanotrophic gill symbiont]
MPKNTPAEQCLINILKKKKKPKFGLKELLQLAFIIDKCCCLYDKLEPKIVSILNFFLE